VTLIKAITPGVSSEMKPTTLLLLIVIQTSITVSDMSIHNMNLIAPVIAIIGLTINTILAQITMEAKSLHPVSPRILAVIKSLVHRSLLIL
jgi:hypothetical protein